MSEEHDAALETLLAILADRQAATAFIVGVVLIQGFVLTLILWLATMQHTFQVPITAYIILATVGLVASASAIPVGIWLWVRAERSARDATPP